jgi:uncharacterized protein YyaL (SSP411 family)
MSSTLVNWLEWNDASFAKAQTEDKPILLDIGAVWCHWCHRMDADTYSQPQVATFINENFIPIKVDNDRRPDINARYNMGGWPTTAFLTPQGETITGATYVPPSQMLGLMRQVAQAYRGNKNALLQETAQVARRREEAGRLRARPDARLSWGIVTQIVGSIARAYDPVYGGLGDAPKFPQAEAYDLLLMEYVNGGKRDTRLTDMVVKSLSGMGTGGMYDQVEGGWFRYSTTRDWSVPHFEKMSEDHAKLLATYLQAYQVTRDDKLKSIAEKSLAYLLNALYDQQRGIFAGSQDADEEYYTLSLAERQERKAPFIDWTAYTDWNAMMAQSLLIASSVLGNVSYREKALRLLDYLWTTCYDAATGALFHFANSANSVVGLLHDHARLAQASLTAFQFTGDVKHLDRATTLARAMLDRLADAEGGGFFDRPDDPKAPGALRTRMKPMFENAVAADAFITLHYLTGVEVYLRVGEAALLVFSDEYAKYDYMAASYGLAVNRAVNEPTEVAVVGAMADPRTQGLLSAAWQAFVPWRIVRPLDLARDTATIAARGFPASDVPAVYVCRGQTCSAPVSDPAALVNLLTGDSG